MACITRHAFLTPGYNCWSLWTTDGCKSVTNEGATHRVMESLIYAIDKMSDDGWHVQDIFVEAGAPTLVLLSKEEPAPVVAAE